MATLNKGQLHRWWRYSSSIVIFQNYLSSLLNSKRARFQVLNEIFLQDTADLELAAAEQRDLQRQLQQIAGWSFCIKSNQRHETLNMTLDDLKSDQRHATLNVKFSRSQYVIHPSGPTSWHWTRPGTCQITKLVMIYSINQSLIPQSRFQRNITDGDFEFLKFLSHDDLTARSRITCFLIYKYLNISEEGKVLKFG